MLRVCACVLLAIGIANPLCCCGASLFGKNALGSEETAHSCCSNNENSSPAEKSGEHSGDCPHKASKQYQTPKHRDAADGAETAGGATGGAGFDLAVVVFSVQAGLGNPVVFSGILFAWAGGFECRWPEAGGGIKGKAEALARNPHEIFIEPSVKVCVMKDRHRIASLREILKKNGHFRDFWIQFFCDKSRLYIRKIGIMLKDSDKNLTFCVINFLQPDFEAGCGACGTDEYYKAKTSKTFHSYTK